MRSMSFVEFVSLMEFVCLVSSGALAAATIESVADVEPADSVMSEPASPDVQPQEMPRANGQPHTHTICMRSMEFVEFMEFMSLMEFV